MSKKNKFEGIINDVGSFASNSNDVDISNADGITAVLKKPILKSKASNTNMSIIVARRQKRK